MNTICELHKEMSHLEESHIIPKFVYKWMKKTGTGRLRQQGRVQIPLQDGIKKKMMCKDCEQILSTSEKWFKENIFDKYLQNNEQEIENSKELLKFCVSILWRVLKYFKDDGIKYNFQTELNEAELEWSNFLLGNNKLNKFKGIHFILVNNKYFLDKRTDLYFSRSVDIDIAESETLTMIYAKFSRFVFIGEIIGFNKNDFENTNVLKEFEFSSNNQVISRNDIFDFFNSRIERLKTFSNLSQEQQLKNNKRYSSKYEEIMKSDLGKIITKHK